LLDPQQFFQDYGQQDLLAHAAFLDRARTERELGREEASRTALGAYLVLRLIDRIGLLEGSEEDRDSFHWQVQTTRRFLSDLPTELTETAHLVGILDIVNRTRRAGPVLRTGLTAYAYSLEHEGRFAEALQVVAVAARTYGVEMPDGDGPTLALFVGRLNRLMARWEAATSSYAAAEQAAQVLGDRRSILLSRLGRANVLRGQGNLAGSRDAIEKILEETVGPELADIRARAYADLGVVFEKMGVPLKALHALYKSFESGPDELHRVRALGDVGIQLKSLGLYAAARRALDLVARGQTSLATRINAYIELLDLESTVGDRVAFERYRRILRPLVDRMLPSAAVDYRFKLGVGMARFGTLPRARALLAEALQLAEQHQLNEWYFRIDRVLGSVSHSGGLGGGLEIADTAGAWEAPAVVEVVEGLERYASSLSD
jgi:tetratricopeptide (TPR) repeat protein